jgi:hypothetical protein
MTTLIAVAFLVWLVYYEVNKRRPRVPGRCRCGHPTSDHTRRYNDLARYAEACRYCAYCPRFR